MAERPDVECESIHPTLPVADVRAAAEWYAAKLGFEIGFTWGEPPTFAGVNFGRTQLFLERATAATARVAVGFVVDEVDALHAFHVANGVEILEPPTDQPYGMRDYAVRDPFGHRLSFAQHLSNGGPPLEIERVGVPLRLEKRLAALLADLAAAKRMSLASCVEEILLHANDGVGPHTKSQLALIARLKAKHGIDYDTHASYRFVER